jgi:hypothetical protein
VIPLSGAEHSGQRGLPEAAKRDWPAGLREDGYEGSLGLGAEDPESILSFLRSEKKNVQHRKKRTRRHVICERTLSALPEMYRMRKHARAASARGTMRSQRPSSRVLLAALGSTACPPSTK